MGAHEDFCGCGDYDCRHCFGGVRPADAITENAHLDDAIRKQRAISREVSDRRRAAQDTRRAEQEAWRERTMHPQLLHLSNAMASAALDVSIALNTSRHRYTTRGGSGRRNHMVTVLGVTQKEMGRVDYITQKAAFPFYGDCRHFQSYIVIELATNRDAWIKEKFIERYGEFGHVVIISPDGTMHNDHNIRGEAKPLAEGPRDDPYG